MSGPIDVQFAVIRKIRAVPGVPLIAEPARLEQVRPRGRFRRRTREFQVLKLVFILQLGGEIGVHGLVEAAVCSEKTSLDLAGTRKG